MNFNENETDDIFDDMNDFLDNKIEDEGGFLSHNNSSNVDVLGSKPPENIGNTLSDKFNGKLIDFGYNLNELKDFLDCEENMLVLSGAGAGKTTGLVFKIIRDLVSGNAVKFIDVPNPNGIGVTRVATQCNILVSTFLKTGAEELEKSFKEWCTKLNVVGIDFSRVKFKTIHAEVYSAIRDMGFNVDIALDTNSLLKTSMQNLGIRSVMAHSRSITQDEVNDVACIVTYARNRLDDKRYEHSLMSDYGLDRLTLDLLIKDFSIRRKASGKCDFEDLQEILYDGLLNNENVRQFIANRYDCIYIDEFQDTSQLQYELIKYYSVGCRKVVAIGDDDQCLVEGTLVRTPFGNRPIETIKRGDTVYCGTGYGETNEYVVDTVSKKYIDKEILEITTKSGRKISGTKEHVGFVLDTGKGNTNYDNSVALTLYEGKEKNKLGIRKSKFKVTSSDVSIKDLINNSGKSTVMTNADDYFCYNSTHIDELSLLCKTIEHGFKDKGVEPKVFRNARLTKNKYDFIMFGSMEVGMIIPSYIDGNIVEDEIVSIDTKNYKGYVYDLSVPKTRNFIANDIVVHNCIYSWRGSDNEIISTLFEQDFKPQIRKLTTNYRCASNILDAVVPSIEKNSKRHGKDLKAYNSGGELKIVKDSNVNYLLGSVKEDLTKFKDIGVLARTNADLLIPAILLELDGSINFSLSKSVSLNSRLPRQVFGMIDLITKRHTEKFCDMFKMFLSKYDHYQAETLDNILRINKNLTLFNIPLRDVEKSVPKLARMIIGLRTACENDKVLGFIFLLELLKSDVFTGQSIYAQKARMFVDFVKKLIIEHKDLKDLSIHELDTLFNDVLQDKLDKRIRLSKASNIKLTTVHEAKGKEWDSVYIWNDIDGCFPNSVGNRDLTLEELEEERRVHYIAWTRARKKLTVFTSSDRMSKFLKECDLSNEGVVEENKAKLQESKVVYKNATKEDIELAKEFDYEQIFRSYIANCTTNVVDMSNLEIVMARYSVEDIAKMLQNDVKLDAYPEDLHSIKICELISELCDLIYESVGGDSNY